MADAPANAGGAVGVNWIPEEKTMRRLFQIAFGTTLIAGAFATAGCQGPWKAERPKAEWKVKEHHSSVVVMSKKLHDEVVRITGEHSERLPDGRLKIAVEIQNKSNKKHVIQVMTVFKDRDGREIGDQTNWEHIVLDPRAITTYTATSFKNAADRYTVRIERRLPRK